ncbi:hypothetical protein BDZ94DRAFT_544141 [Collybia nuda]|uniref:Glucose-methanol-choline oxidoreductase N-terminal domain-containing protein n=1 Tax=Collybia nuda TaxID=64659 RepID=A0A9P5YHN8_9AGAR|nr:hypothetical protein BDZ94DRAFT_544141 [Collybia nuda]
MPIVSIEHVSNKSFDYIIIGGGTAGLVLAARLTEDPNASVLVLEAGQPNFEDPAILRPGQYGSHFGQPDYDWAMKTVPQQHSNGTEIPWPRGRGLGGSSAINFMAWTIPPKEDIDDWERLGNEGWNWNDFAQYLERSATFTPLKLTPEELQRRGAESYKGFEKTIGSGPLHISHPKTIIDADIKMQETLNNMGIPTAPLPITGNPRGTLIAPNTIDPISNTRSYSATAYLHPNAERPNLTVLTSAYVYKIVTSMDNEIIATGVEFAYAGDRIIHLAHAKKEVVLSAGALKTPQLLELSGIGRPDILEKIGVPLKLTLDGVGENVQEHLWTGVSFEMKDNIQDETFDILRSPGVTEKHIDLFALSQGVFTMGVVNFAFQPLDALSDQAPSIHENVRADIKDNIRNGNYSPGLVDQYLLQLERLSLKGLGCEIMGFPGFLSFPNPPIPGKKYFSILIASNHTFSRGSIHAVSNDPILSPIIDPHCFEKDIDLQTLVEMTKFARKVAATAPFKDFLGENVVEVNPGPDVKTHQDIEEWMKGAVCTTYHTVGSASMLPREKGGVVDNRLKVYGTRNLRIADISIVPLHFASHAQSVAYVIGEKAADIIAGKI